MRASIVIPAHNEEEYLSATLQAVCALKYPDFEIILVNNASTDRTGEIAQSFAPKVKVVHETRKGLLFAREAGRHAAKGDIIVQLDADCLPHADWLAKGVAPFSQDSNIVAVSGPYYYHDAHPVFTHTSYLTQIFFYKPASVVLQLFGRGAVLIGGNTFIRTEALEKIGGYDTTIVFYGEDTDIARRLAKHGKVLFKNNLRMKTSARRFADQGTLQLFYLYLANFFSVTFFRKPYTTE